jgi:hypothetical protein
MTDKEKKVRKTATVRRPKFADEKYLGPEPKVTKESTDCEIGNAYSWFNYFYSSEDAKSFAISYLKSIKYDKEIVSKLSRAKAIDIHSVGWNCRLLAQGSTLPDIVWNRCEERIRTIASSVSGDDELVQDTPTKVISIQERINRKSSELIGELEEQMDVFFKAGVVSFDVKKWSVDKAIKPAIAKRIADHFRPQFEEIALAVSGKDAELTEAYAGWKKPILKIMAVFLKRIIDHMVELESAGIAVRKPRKKKVKPVSQQVAKMKFKEEDKELNLKSVNPCEVVGAQQLWVYNCKYRNLTVYNAVGNSGLAVRGTTVLGFDEATSITKKLRKPLEILHRTLNEGKVGLRKVMTSIRTAEKKANGRINAECILLRAVK